MSTQSPHTTPASPSSHRPPGTSSFAALTTQSNTHGTAAQRKMSVPPHHGVNNSGLETAMAKPAHRQTGLRFKPSLKNGYASLPQPHQPRIVAAAPSTLTTIPTLTPQPRRAAAHKE